MMSLSLEIDGISNYEKMGKVIDEFGLKWYLKDFIKEGLLLPEKNGDELTLLGCTFRPSILIHGSANPDMVIEAWNWTSSLIDSKKILLMYYLYIELEKCRLKQRSHIQNYLGLLHSKKQKFTKEEETTVIKYKEYLNQTDWLHTRHLRERSGFDHPIEPDFTRFLKLCYWMFIDYQISVIKNDILQKTRISFIIHELNVIADKLSKLLTQEINNLDNDCLLEKDSIDQLVIQFKNLNTFLAVNLSELIIAGLIQTEKKEYAIKFVDTKICQQNTTFLEINDHRLGVITIVDRLRGLIKREDSLEYTIGKSLADTKIKSLINETLKSKPHVIVLVLSHSMVGYHLLDNISSSLSNDELSIEKSFDEAYRQLDILKSRNRIPLILLADGIILNEGLTPSHSTFSKTVDFPII